MPKRNEGFEPRIILPENIASSEGRTLALIAQAVLGIYWEKAGKPLKVESSYTPMGWAVTTSTDIKIHELIKTLISNKHPNHQIFSEEERWRDVIIGSKLPTWVVDPIDGSTAYSREIKGGFCTAVGVVVDGEAVAGLVLDPFTIGLSNRTIGRTWFAENGNGAWLNGARLPARKNDVTFENAFLAMQRIRTPDLPDSIKLDPFWKELWTKRHSYTAHTSQVLAYMMVITGEFDGAVANQGARPWDIAAPLAIAQEVDGILMTDLFGHKLNPLERPNGVIIAPPLIHEGICQLASQALLS